MLAQKRVLTCINEPDISCVVSLCLQREFAQQYDLSVIEARFIDKLLAKAEGDPPDLFILLLNNMFYSETRFYGDGKKNRIARLLEVITRLRHTYHKPVIAMTGWPLSADSWNEENTREAGASFLLPLPVDGSLLRHAARQCFEEEEVGRHDLIKN